MASPRASRGPPPLLLLLLLLLLLPAAPGTWGQVPAPARRAPLSGTGLRRPAPLAPGHAIRRERSGRVPRGVSAAAIRNNWPESNTEPHIENIAFYQNPEDFSTVDSKEGTLVQTSRMSHTSSEAPENLTLLIEKASAEGRKESSSRRDFTISPAVHSPEIATVLTSQDSTFSPGTIKEHNSRIFQSPSVSQTKSMHVATTFTDDASAPRELQSLPVSLGPINKTVGFPEDSKIAATSATVHSSPSVVELRRNRSIAKNPADEEFIQPSTESEFDITSSHKQNDSPTFGRHQLTSGPEAGNKNSMPHTETVSKSVPSIRGGESTAHWFLTNSKTSADVTGSSASYDEVLTQFSDSAQQSTAGNLALDERSYSESSSQRLESSAQRGEHSTQEDSAVPGLSSATEESTSGAHPRGAHTLATLTRIGERTLRSISLTDVVTSAEAGRSAMATGETEGTAQRSNVTDDMGLLSQSTAALPALGVTGFSYGQVSGTDTEQRTSSDHTDHTYVSSAFTKGERALLSITDNSSSLDTSESSTSYIKISNASYSDYSSSSRVQTKRSNVSSYDGEYSQPSTESLVLHTSNFPSYTPTIKIPNIFVPLGTDTGSVGDSSSSESPLPLPSVSQSLQVSSSLPSTRTSTHQLKSTSEVSTTSSSPSTLLSVSLMASTTLSVSQATLPHPSSTPVLSRTRETPVTSVQMLTMASSIAMSHSSQTADPQNQSTPQQEKIVTEAKSPSLVSLPTESTKAVTKSSLSQVPLPSALTESSTEPTLTAMSTSLAHMSPTLTTTTLKTSHLPVVSPSTLSSTEPLITGPGAILTTTGKQLLSTHPEILVPQISTEGDIITKRNQVHTDATTQLIPLTSVPTSAKELTTRLDVTKEYSPASPFLRTSPFSKTTDVSTAEMLTPKSPTPTAQSSTQSPMALSPVNSCATNPCLHDGKCIVDLTSRGYVCVCPPSWQGDNCSVDVNECLLNRCPRQAICNNTQGSFICRCPVGYHLEKGICNLVRTFVTEFKLKKQFLNTTLEKHLDVHEVGNEITKTLNVCFSTLPGYIRSTVHVSRESSAFVTSLQTSFSLASSVTLFDLNDGIQKFVNSCRSSSEVCQLLGSQIRVFRAGSLCKRKSPQCDKETSICTDLDGVALCQCKSGYFQFNKMDHSCRACEDGYRLENETCMSCPFGLGGLNCGNPYQLITVVIAAAGGGLLLVLGIALIVTCCRKNKNDISKLIFKSGDFQMSPYAEYPKNPRSQEWGREAIEMQENGSTKNLLQMTDVYYSPTNVRNLELERNGLYPAYTGLPGSRHSCIFPGQYNPSFISDESRRRDYF
ncbi:protein HEG homolog 1 isoform X1 [Heterocephalus glaber]|uniref:Protein HEG homolog 1 n=2 Tax=Heterocephalus glaber TaxID=10181 RepID=A0AAX6T1M9_HETGA|nr:protein HEG homolog 1 isoform X1 [Heterocephalus glaber]